MYEINDENSVNSIHDEKGKKRTKIKMIKKNRKLVEMNLIR